MGNWKKVSDSSHSGIADHTHRLEVPGGYLYRNIFISDSGDHVSLVFVPVSHCSTCRFDLLKFCGNCNSITLRKKDCESG